MKEDTRAGLTGTLWFLSTVVLVALFISAAAQGEFTPGHVVFAFVLLALTVGATPILLRWQGGQAQQEKAKRQGIEALLRDMSTEDLIELKQRLADVDDHEATTLDYLDDDGELVLR